jgi:hypothetical protein
VAKQLLHFFGEVLLFGNFLGDLLAVRRRMGSI